MWFEDVVKPCLKGRAFLVRYADDFVMGFACAEDARRVLAVLPQRFGRYGLTIHPDKTRRVPFGRPGRGPTPAGVPGASPAGSFDFLGFTHFWSRSKKGSWVVKRQTAGSRFRRALKKIADWCRQNRHEPMAERHRTLWPKLRGHFQYYGGLVGNGRALWCWRRRVEAIWRKWRSRRSGQAPLTWERLKALLGRFDLPVPPGWVSPCVVKP